MRNSRKLLTIGLILLLAFFFSFSQSAVAAEQDNATSSSVNEKNENITQAITQSIDLASNYVIKKGVNSEWEAIVVAKAGKTVPESYNATLKAHIQDQVVKGLESKRIKITDIERLAIATVAIGKDPRNIDGINLIELIYNSPERRGGYDTMTFQGNNGPIFALIALDTKKFEVPEDAKWTRQKLVDELLRTQNKDGSWNLNENFNSPSIDITAMAITGLSPYKDQSKVKKALDKAVAYLSSVQTEEGGFDGGSFVGGITSEAASQVIIGLSAYGIDATGEMFTKNGTNLIEHLLSFQNEDGGFAHTKAYNNSNAMATEQALQAIVAYNLYVNNHGSLYHFTKSTSTPGPKPDPDNGDGQEENEDTNKQPENPSDNENQNEKPNPNPEKPGTNTGNEDSNQTPGENEGKVDSEKPNTDSESPEEEQLDKGDLNEDTSNEKDGNKEEEDQTTPPGSVDDNDQNNSNQLQVQKESNKEEKASGKKLPKTATNSYNFLLIGVMLIIIGSVIFFIRKRRLTE